MKKYTYYILVAVVGLFMAACSSTKKLTKTTIGNLTEEQYFSEVISRAPDWKAITAKMNLTLTQSVKEINVSGSLKMKRDEVILISIAPVLGIEVARAEITPAGILVVDRIHKRYVKVPFEELTRRTNADLDFHAFQSLFMNEIFLPGKNSVSVKDVNAFTIRQDTAAATLAVKNAKRFIYQFTTTIAQGLLKQTYIGMTGTEYGIKWQYGNFKDLENKQFPTKMFVAVEGSKKSLTAMFDFSRLSTDADWDSNTQLSDKYEEVELDDILKILLK
ncbi:MAG: DUF4292 domain-containing protein [Phocaeicola sp.]|uniref:DUF4292 domain-containing protein n=1 Tax=Phocaeicola sp. TaxID=2773926 RepID=UPI003FA09748